MNNKRKVLVTSFRLYAPKVPGLERLEAAGFELVFNKTGKPMPQDEFLRMARGCFATIAGSERYDATSLRSLPDLRLISRFGVGYDAIDLGAATEHGVVVCTAVGGNHESVADLAFSLTAALFSELFFYHGLVAGGGWGARAHGSLWKSTLGIVGLGRIGRALARRAKGFEMRILARDIVEDHAFAKANGIEYVDLDTLLKQSDVVSLHVPKTPETTNMIDARRLALMKPTAYLVQTSRGGIVDEDAMVDALANKRLAGAGVDVFRVEPPRDSPLFKAPNVILSPHAAGGNIRAQEMSMDICVDQILAMGEGKRPKADCVRNPEVWDKLGVRV
jgi:D-3-phosphoglycerate dehydrogenase